MAFWIASSPHNHIQAATPSIMRWVILATIPGVFAQWYFFGWGNLIQITLAVAVALLAEMTVLALREKPISNELYDGSSILTAVLIGIALPSMAPWWIVVMGTLFAIVVVKHLYGGIGHNLFNPAMAAYVMLLISFPLQMTTWLPPVDLIQEPISLYNSAWVIFTGYTSEGFSLNQLISTVDGHTLATPLDTLKTELSLGKTVSEAYVSPVFGDYFSLGWEWVNLGFLAGGIFLLAKNIIDWRIPVSFLAGLMLFSFIGYAISPDASASTMFHWLSGGCMLGAFFIFTDPVTASTTAKGRIIFGLIAALLVYLIRTFGGYPDAIAFAILLCNMCAPLIDQYARPRTFGHNTERIK